MARILLAWELGDGLGHVGRLLPIAAGLKALGHECVLAVRDLVASYPLTRLADIWVLQAPYASVPQVAAPVYTGGYVDILAFAGFGDPLRLEALVAGWDDLLAYVQPDLIVGDFCPFLSLATYSTAIPLILIGDGFTLPPERGELLPFPGLLPRNRDAELLEVVGAVQARRRRPALPRLSALFRARDSFVVTFSELDPYAALRVGNNLGPLQRVPEPALDEPESDWFAYLSLAHPGTDLAIDVLARHSGTGSLYLRDASETDLQRVRARGLAVHDRPQDLATAVGAAGIVIHHGGVGTSEIALALGRPHLLVPRHLEQRMNAHALGTLGVAVGMGRQFARTRRSGARGRRPGGHSPACRG